MESLHRLTPRQIEIVNSPLETTIFLEGLAGVGKTTVGIARMLHLLNSGEPGNTIAIITPQRSLAEPYLESLYNNPSYSGGQVNFFTVGGMAQRMVNLFWPLISRQAGFARPNDPPIFLTLETAQYYMSTLVRPLLDKGYFDSLVMDRNRLYSQILDNLNKASLVGFPFTEIGDRLKSAWTGEPAQLRVYDDTQDCANRFREFCLQNNLLDFSLQMETFVNHVWSCEQCFEYLTRASKHLIIDNIEEDTPIAHDLLREWIPASTSSFIIYDHEGGYRRFLGADPVSAYQLKDICSLRFHLDDNLIASHEIQDLKSLIVGQLSRNKVPSPKTKSLPALRYTSQRFFPQMLDWVTMEISELVNKEGISPSEIVVLSPFLSDSLRFALTNRLVDQNIQVRTHRPSRSLRDDPVTQCLYTFSAIAHPEWHLSLNKFDVINAMTQAIEGLDLVRAQLLVEIIFRSKDSTPTLSSFSRIHLEMQERITYQMGERYEAIKDWIDAYKSGPPIELEYFIRRLFGELLSQPGYGFHSRYEAGEVTAKLIESIYKFRRVVVPQLATSELTIGKDYWQMVQEGVIAAQYLQHWGNSTQDAVLLVPAHTFLMINHPVDVQFWLDIGSRAWAERLNQPLTQPYILSRQWNQDQVWTDLNEIEVEQKLLTNLVTGLLQRCRNRLYLGISEFSEQGYEQRSILLRTFQHVMRELNKEGS